MHVRRRARTSSPSELAHQRRRDIDRRRRCAARARHDRARDLEPDRAQPDDADAQLRHSHLGLFCATRRRAATTSGRCARSSAARRTASRARPRAPPRRAARSRAVPAARALTSSCRSASAARARASLRSPIARRSSATSRSARARSWPPAAAARSTSVSLRASSPVELGELEARPSELGLDARRLFRIGRAPALERVAAARRGRRARASARSTSRSRSRSDWRIRAVASPRFSISFSTSA